MAAPTYILFMAKLTDQDSANLIPRTGDAHSLGKLTNLIHKIQAGMVGATGGFTVIDGSGTEPVGTVTVTATGVTTATTLTFTFGSFAITKTAGTDFTIDTTSDATQATYLYNALQDDKFLRTVLSFSISTNVITVTGNMPGDFLENVTMTENGTDFALVQIGAGTAGVNGAAEYFFQGRKYTND